MSILGGIGYYEQPLQQPHALLTEGHRPQDLVLGRQLLPRLFRALELANVR